MGENLNDAVKKKREIVLDPDKYKEFALDGKLLNKKRKLQACCVVDEILVNEEFDSDMDEEVTEAELAAMDEALNAIMKKEGIVSNPEIYEEVNEVEQVALEEELNTILNKKSKDVHLWFDPPGTVVAPTTCVVDEILVKDGMMVKKDDPMFVLDLKIPSTFSQFSEKRKSEIKKNMQEDLHDGSYSVEDVLVNQDYDPILGFDNEDVLKKYENFNKFDTVLDHSDHLFAAHALDMSKLPKEWPDEWANKIRDEWRILEQHLPERMFVRVYESRMDLLRVVIIGPEGTPYHDGVFVFDVCFKSTYPYSPPLVRYHSGGVGINPNVYKCGEVDLRFLVTSSGQRVGKWENMLQLVVFMQDAIFSRKPYFNTVGSQDYGGCEIGEMMSLLYNENTVINSLKSMVYTINKPPKNFEDLVVGHFRKRVCDVLMACKAYMEEENGNGTIEFRNDVASCIKPLVDAFNKIGAKGAQEFLYLSENRIPLPLDVSEPTLDLPHHPYTLVAPTDFPRGGKVLVEVGMEVGSGHHFFVSELKHKPPKDL